MEQTGLNTKKIKRSLIVGFIMLPIVLLTTTMVLYRNPSFIFFQGFSNHSNINKDNVLVHNENRTASAPAPVANDRRNITPASAAAADDHRNISAASALPGVGNRNVVEPSPSAPAGGRKRDVDADQLSFSRNDFIPTSSNDSHSTPTTTMKTNKNNSISIPILKNSSSHEPNNETTTTDSIQNKKLLDGLIPLGFDEPSCISRYDSYKYHKQPSPHKPSPYLISKLRSYEDLHRRCGPRSKSYAQAMSRLERSGNINYSDSSTVEHGYCKYMVWTAVNGLGNRMISMVSLFLYAVLTDRVFLLELEKPMVGLFCEPFLHSTWELPAHFPYSHRLSHLRTYEEFWKMRYSGGGSGSSNDQHDRVRLPSMMFLDLGHGHDVLSHPFHCDKNQLQILEKVPVLAVRTDQYIVPSLYMSQTFRQELDKMFPEKETVFYHLGRYLFHPSNQVWELITRFYDAYLARSDQRIGLQIRVFSPQRTPSRTIVDQILACSTKYNILPQLLPPSSSSNNSTQTTRTSPASSEPISILVTSLQPDYVETLKKMYRSQPTVNGEFVGVYQPSYEGKQKSRDSTHNVKALTDMYLLSLCDVLVTSGVSTFGYVAQGLGGLKPYIMQKPNGEKVRNPACRPALSMEPCNHFPPMVDCVGNHVKNISEVWTFMRPCEDRRSGVKLVDI